MKIEKLTENKIRVIIHSDEIKIKDLNMYNIMKRPEESQKIFSSILKKAEKEVDFHTDGCKLLFETFSSIEDTFVLTITKYSIEPETKPKKLIAKRKSFNSMSQQSVCLFENFDTFCKFCNHIKILHKFDSHKFAQNIALYFWKDNYYLVLKNVKVQYKHKEIFYSTLSEFGKLFSASPCFEHKLLEHGKVIIKKNAIDVGINFFS